jgi:aarF domain-containing kinase
MYVSPVAVGAAGAGSAMLPASPSHAATTNAKSKSNTKTSPFEPTIRAFKFWRRVGPIVLHYKLTQAWMKGSNAGARKRAATWNRLHEMHAQDSLDVILELRGLFVKIGQVMSSRADFVPMQYCDKFSSLQDAVPPWPKDRVEVIVRESLREAQNVAMEDVFESFGEVLGSASIGQCHRATLTRKYSSIGKYRGGKDVAVKVMHPDAENRFKNDFKIFRALCKVALPGWDPILRELEMQMMTEFDYVNESRSLDIVRTNICKSPYANKVRIPQPVREICSKNLLVMEYLPGKKLAVAIEERLADILGGDIGLARKVLRAKTKALFDSRDVGHKSGRKKFSFAELSDMIAKEGNKSNVSLLQKGAKALKVSAMTKDARRKLNLLLDVTGHQIFQDGIFNGDAHPGNILELDSGRLGLIDYGQCRTLTEHDRLALAGVVAALGKNSDNKSIADAMRSFGFRSRDDNDKIIAKNAALYFDSDSEGRKMGCATPQTYLQYLNSIDPMVEVPDAAVFVARTSFLFRGLGALLQQQLHTAKRWSTHAQIALEDAGLEVAPYRLGLSATKESV